MLRPVDNKSASAYDGIKNFDLQVDMLKLFVKLNNVDIRFIHQ